MAEAAKVLKDNPEMLKMAADMFDKLSPGGRQEEEGCQWLAWVVAFLS
jgi:hypothetical protein